jgi:hypothetical protein
VVHGAGGEAEEAASRCVRFKEKPCSIQEKRGDSLSAESFQSRYKLSIGQLVIYNYCYRSHHPEFIKASMHPVYNDKMHDPSDLTYIIGVYIVAMHMRRES